MTSIKLFLNETQQIGPIQVWPLKVTGVSESPFQVPPFLDQLVFNEHDDGDGPRVNTIEVRNPTSQDFIIPIGWIVGANLLQVRTFNNTEHIAAGETIIAEVSCVEKGRWAAGQNEIDGGRAPLSVLGAGWDFDVETRVWKLDRSSRQSRVWAQVSKQEMRGGARETNSLQQIMAEDSVSAEIPRLIQRFAESEIRTHDEQNGFLICADGAPLLMEFFANSLGLENTVLETIRAISFDLAHLDYRPASKTDIRKFVDQSRLGELTRLGGDQRAARFAGGINDVHSQVIKDERGNYMHAFVLNRRHKILQGV